jgi:spermidine/putrescine transport system substrate-binding protein
MVMDASPRKDLAMSFINFLNELENAARLAEYVNFASPNKAALQLLPQEHLKNPIIYPDKEVLDRSEFFQNASFESTKEIQHNSFQGFTRAQRQMKDRPGIS